jgi:hypothetical protein
VPDFSPLLRPLVLPPDTLAGWQEGWMLLEAVIFGVLITAVPSRSAARRRGNQPQI